MATLAPRSGLTAGLVDRLLAGGAVALLLVVLTALARSGGVGGIDARVLLHLGMMMTALALTPAMLLLPRGTRRHRQLGWVWAAVMAGSALASLTFEGSAGHPSRGVLDGHWSPIHLLSLFVLVQVPRLVWLARTHQVARHRFAVRGVVIGGLLAAGSFTFLPSRLLGHWLVG